MRKGCFKRTRRYAVFALFLHYRLYVRVASRSFTHHRAQLPMKPVLNV